MGRPQGASNRITQEIREKIQLILDSEFETIEETLNSLPPKDRLEIILKLMRFAIPQLKEITIQDERPQIDEIRVNIVK